MGVDDLSKTKTKAYNMDKYKTKMTINKWFSYISLETLSESSLQTISQFNRYSKKLTQVLQLKNSL
jgi:hypothetical protein